MKIKNIGALVIFCFCSLIIRGQQKSQDVLTRIAGLHQRAMLLKYDKPIDQSYLKVYGKEDGFNELDGQGKGWVEALPIGNGKLGAMVFGNVHKEHLQLNEESLWVGYR